MAGKVESTVGRFFASEALGGMLLIGAAALAVAVANSGLAASYRALLQAQTGPILSPALGSMTVHLWINDALMAVFFLLVGLELKREFFGGDLASWQRRRLPIVAAGAGMAVPALVYLGLAGGDPVLARGWAIPAATDIAFAIGVVTLLGSRVPASLKLFLVAVAIADDLGAVAIIAVAYTDRLNPAALVAAVGIFLILCLLGRMKLDRLWPYLIGGVLLWYAVMLSGVHPTIAGVLTAAAIPLARAPGEADSHRSPLHRLERRLAPWVAGLILPLFGFANAGIDFSGIGPGAWLAPLPLGIAAGLFAGKQAGIFGSVWLCVRLGLADRPRGANWLQFYGIALLCGIGFTMSFFIGALAFSGRPLLIEQAKTGILAGSLLSAIAGYLVLRFAPARADPAEPGASA